MAPRAGGGGCTTRRVRASTRKPRTHCKKRVLKPKNIQETPQEHCLSGNSTKKQHDQDIIDDDDDQDGDASTSGCSTPKAERFRIPETETCPPAPKKPRPAGPTCSSSLHRSPIAFFASPDIELFFFVALTDHASIS